jgi:hypothetical protein
MLGSLFENISLMFFPFKGAKFKASSARIAEKK